MRPLVLAAFLAIGTAQAMSINDPAFPTSSSGSPPDTTKQPGCVYDPTDATVIAATAAVAAKHPADSTQVLAMYKQSCVSAALVLQWEK